MKKIFEWFGGSVLKDLLGGLDKLFTSKEEKIKAERKSDNLKWSQISKSF